MNSLKITIKWILVVSVAAISMYGCKSGSTLAPSTKSYPVAFGVKAVNSSSALAAASTSKFTLNSVAPAIQFTAGTANIAKFKLEAKTANSNVEIETKNLMNVDLFAVAPLITTATLDTGTYREIEVRLELVESADTSATPLKLRGTFTAADGSIIPVQFNINQTLTIKAEANNILLHNTSDLSAIVLLHLDKVVAGITASDLSSATKTNGVIIISNTSNISLFNRISFNIEGCGDTEVKEDGAGHGDGPAHN